MSCYGPSLTAVALIRLTDVRDLTFYDNNNMFFERDILVSLTELKILELLGCDLRTIELGAFNGLTKLTELSIYDNKISELISDTFVNLGNLEQSSIRV